MQYAPVTLFQSSAIFFTSLHLSPHRYSPSPCKYNYYIYSTIPIPLILLPSLPWPLSHSRQGHLNQIPGQDPEDVAQCKWSFLTVHQFERPLHGTSTATICSVGLQQVSGEIFSIIYLGSRTVDTCEKYNQHLYHNNSTRLRK